MPVGDVLVGDSRCDIKHDDCALSVDVVPVSQTTKLLLTSGIPDIELDGAKVLETVRACSRNNEEGGQRTVVKPRG